jgi:hypothetical protein
VSFSIANDTFYLVSDTLKAGIVLCVLGLCLCAVVQTWLASRLPATGAAWGLTFTMSLTTMHFAYAAWWFRRRPPDAGPSSGRFPPPRGRANLDRRR